MPSAPRLASAGLTDQGNVRGNNEDRFHIDDGRGIYMVVDGMGGQAAGEEAAEIAVKTLRARLERQTEDPDLRIREAIALANNAIFDAANGNPEWHGMACVLTVAVVEDGWATVGHVGDSRLYFIRAGQIEKITRDHSPVGEREDSGELTEDAAMKHPRRNEVYRDVGSAARTPDDPDFIDVQKIRFPADGALLLCSDGLSDVLPSRRILQVVEENAGDCEAALRKLIKEAVADGKDNVSAVLVEGEEFAQLVPAASNTQAPAFVPEPQRPSRKFGWLALGAVLGGFAVESFHLLQAPAAASGPKILHVAPAGGDFSSIPEAVLHANPGDTIELAPGDYLDRVLLRNGTRLVGPVRGVAVIGGGIFADGVRDASLLRLEARGITIRSAIVEIDSVRVTGAKGPGVEYAGDSQGILRNSEIVGNSGAGVVVRDNASPEIKGNYIAGNGKGADNPRPGVELLSTAAPRLSQNGIGGNGAEPLWVLARPSSPLLETNILQSAKQPYKVVKP